MYFAASSLTRILICFATKFTLICSTNRVIIFSRSSSSKDVNRITSSRRLRNSGLKAFFTSAITWSSTFGGTPVLEGAENPICDFLSRNRAPRFEVSGSDCLRPQQQLFLHGWHVRGGQLHSRPFLHHHREVC